MPHALSMPHSGFQALILCGPGIGLSTFTSVPNEFPKALVTVANRPMVWYVLDWCYRMGVTDITLVAPPTSHGAIAAALAQNPYLTSLPAPSPDLISPPDLDFTTPTAALLRLPEVQDAIKTDFMLLPCDLVCDVPGETFLESYLTSLAGLGGVGSAGGDDLGISVPKIIGLGGERSGRRGGLSVWYCTVNREESVKGEECDFMATAKLDPGHDVPVRKRSLDSEVPQGTLRKLVWAMPMSSLTDECEENKSWHVRQSLLNRYGRVKCLTQFRDAHIYLFPYWVKDFARLNEVFESVSEDLIGTWAKSEWRKPSYRARLGAWKIFGGKEENAEQKKPEDIPIEEEINILSLSSTQTTRHLSSQISRLERTTQLASRVPSGSDPDDPSTLSPKERDEDASDSSPPPLVPPILSYIHPSAPTAPLLRRMDTTPLLLSVSLLLAKIPAIDESPNGKATPTTSPFAHPSKVATTATVAPRTTITRSDCLIGDNASVSSQCVIKTSMIGPSVTVGTGARLTKCLVMEGAVIGEKCVLTGTVVGKKAMIGRGCVLQNCEVQDGNAVSEGTEGKDEKFLVGGLEEEMSGEEGAEVGADDDDDEEDGFGPKL